MHERPLEPAVALPHPQPVAGVDDDGDAHSAAEHPAQDAGLRVVGVQDVQPQPAQQPGQLAGSAQVLRRPPRAGQRVDRDVPDAEGLDPLDVRSGR